MAAVLIVYASDYGSTEKMAQTAVAGVFVSGSGYGSAGGGAVNPRHRVLTTVPGLCPERDCRVGGNGVDNIRSGDDADDRVGGIGHRNAVEFALVHHLGNAPDV
jgi:hypothetical protein